MGISEGESKNGALLLDFDRSLTLEFHNSLITSDAGLLAYREIGVALGFSAMAADILADSRRPAGTIGLLLQSVFGGASRPGSA